VPRVVGGMKAVATPLRGGGSKKKGNYKPQWAATRDPALKKSGIKLIHVKPTSSYLRRGSGRSVGARWVTGV